MRVLAVTLITGALLSGVLTIDASAAPPVPIAAGLPLTAEYPDAEQITIGSGSSATPAIPFSLPGALVTGSATESAGLRWLGWCYTVGACGVR
ncbi:hypothetical protein [Nocardia aurantia]|uniref:Uncharacterized protein n=1 Tax=Nocardia aurantia TaxID=2585199 RepID=A0A7K0DUS9_9NOCA|nr:hypothetical protein [Nocardia aurantia]MQY29506.1 hypothetical protein [Nocardia aurantia]